MFVWLTLLGARVASADPLLTITPASGFIDDAFALRSDGSAVAHIVTDGASTATLITTPVGGKAVTVGAVSPFATNLYFVGPNRLLVVATDGNNTKVTGHIVGGGKTPPADAIAVGRANGKSYVFAYTEKGNERVVTAYSAESLGTVTRRSFKEDSEGRITVGSSRLKPLWWQDGFATLATQKGGDYDKKHDIRNPDEFALLDVISGKLRNEKPIENVLGFMQIALAHKDKHDAAFARFNDDRSKFLVVDGAEEFPITLARDPSMYQMESLHSQIVDDDHVAFSLVTDPLNPDALKRQKADPDIFELYVVDRKARAVKRVLELPAEGRPIAWKMQGHRVAILHKSKGFDRGGVRLELYQLP